MNLVHAKKKPGTVLKPRFDPSRTRNKSTRKKRRRLLRIAEIASEPPSLVIKLKNERFITAKNQVETINKNNNVVTEPKRNENFAQVIEDENFSEKDDCDIYHYQVPCESCILEEVIVEHGCDDEILVVKNHNSVFDFNDNGGKTPELTEVDLRKSDLHLKNDVLDLDLLERFVQYNPEGHSLVKQDLEKNLFGDLESYLGELMPKARDLDT